MNISTEGVVLFLHIAVVLVSFMVAAVLHASLHALPRAKTVQEMRLFAALVHRLEPLFPILAIFILGFGFWLIHLEDLTVHDGWVLVGLISLVAVEALAGALLAPHSKKLVSLIEESPDGVVPANVRTASLDPVIWDLAHVATVSFLGVVFVMTAKPSGGASAAIVAIGAVIGVALSRWQIGLGRKVIAATG